MVAAIKEEAYCMNSRVSIDFDSPKIKRYNHVRKLKDKAASVSIAWGGVAVLVAILLIFAYLLYEVLPMFSGASVDELTDYEITQEVETPESKGKTLYLAMEEQNKVGLQVLDTGLLRFFNIEDGKVIQQQQVVPNGSVSSFALNNDASQIMAFGLNSGGVKLIKVRYKITYPDNVKTITPVIEYPYGEQALDFGTTQLNKLAIRDGEESLMIMAETADGLVGTRYEKTESLFGDEVELSAEELELPKLDYPVSNILIDSAQRFVFFMGHADHFSYLDLFEDAIYQEEVGSKVLDSRLLLGGISLLIAQADGVISQWFPVPTEDGARLKNIRQFEDSYHADSVVLGLEQRRKGFLSAGSDGRVQIFHSTAQNSLLDDKLVDGGIDAFALSPRADRLLLMSNNSIKLFEVDNEHPEVSWHSLWGKVWYESYPEPTYTWQSSSSSNDFEPKLSLTPLAFGTLKAAFYAMIMAAPLAVCGAIYTAYFMTPVMRRKIKPLIELMEALPTVILGFLAGLWLAPFMEQNLFGIFTVLFMLPITILIFAFIMSRLPVSTQNQIDEGWHGFLLIPFVVLVVWACFAISPGLEQMIFPDSNLRLWFTREVGIPFDQRNALVVGLAMGFAVIPTIFSIAEDAIFSVPKHLSQGSLALGATPWQTLTGVVLPTASPGIFSGLMIGLGRAVGETMIVLMATGNTPIMDANIFEGMRTLSANLAVEIPEAEVDSTHYRVLFLAAFVLFLFTFVFNTAAEVIRQRLRKKYGSL